MSLLGAFCLVATTRFPVSGAAARSGEMPAVLDGIGLLARRDDLRGLFMLAAIPCFCVFPYISFLAVYAQDELEIGAQGLGLLMAAPGIGAVVGGLLGASAKQGKGVGRTILITTIAYSFCIIAFAVPPTIWIALPFLVVTGLLGSYFMSSNNVLIQLRITDDVRGRVMGAYMLTWSLMPLGALPMGPAADLVGIRIAPAGGAVLSIALITLLAHRNQSTLEL
jgi:MFS transporter, DHA1 family, staphyloferrin A biosynthesis exporter